MVFIVVVLILKAIFHFVEGALEASSIRIKWAADCLLSQRDGFENHVTLVHLPMELCKGGGSPQIKYLVEALDGWSSFFRPSYIRSLQRTSNRSRGFLQAKEEIRLGKKAMDLFVWTSWPLAISIESKLITCHLLQAVKTRSNSLDAWVKYKFRYVKTNST